MRPKESKKKKNKAHQLSMHVRKYIDNYDINLNLNKTQSISMEAYSPNLT
jgi:hypothetical protein